MLEPRWGLGPVSIVLIAAVTSVVCVALIDLIRRPPRDPVLLWPAAFVLLYVFCVMPLVSLLSAAHVPVAEGTNAMAGMLLIALTLFGIRRPNRLAFLALAMVLLGFFLRYAIAFYEASHGAPGAAIALVLRKPLRIATFVGQGAALIAAILLAALAIGRPDVFRKPVETMF